MSDTCQAERLSSPEGRGTLSGARGTARTPMITKFDSSYYGTVDMANLGYTGTPINDRCYSKEQLAGALHKVVAYARCMDGRANTPFWLPDHFFHPEGRELIPNLLMRGRHPENSRGNLKI